MPAPISQSAEEIMRRVRERLRNQPAEASAAWDEAGSGGNLFDLGQLQRELYGCHASHSAVGSINPRRGGPYNALIQFTKKVMRRSLTWYTRPLHQFQGSATRALQESLKALQNLQANVRSLEMNLQGVSTSLRRLDDHLQKVDGRFLAAEERLLSAERHLRRMEHLGKQPIATAVSVQTPITSAASELDFDYFLFEERFRGQQADIKARQLQYVEYFKGRANVVDLGCGRGEFLELLRENAIPAKGVESSADAYLLCKEKGLQVERQDIFSYLESQPDAGLDGVFAAQVIEHLPVQLQVQLTKLLYAKLRPQAPVVLETINPECVLALVRNFYLDPTHIRPVHPELLKFLLESAGFAKVELKFSARADSDFPASPERATSSGNEQRDEGLQKMKDLLFGYQDYAAIGWRA